MKIIEVKNYHALSMLAAKIIIDEVREKPNLVIGFATGKTPLKLYKNLVGAYRKGEVDFSGIKTFNLDEYYPIKQNEYKKSYRSYMSKRFFSDVNIPKENIHLLDGNSKDIAKSCKDYENQIRKNPIDLQILGIGINGHIGFNEPGSKKDSKTRVVKLSPSTIKRNKVSYTKALTMGISTIMKSKKIILLASGKSKAEVIERMIKGKESEKLPASFLKNHKDITVIVDKKAGSLI